MNKGPLGVYILVMVLAVLCLDGSTASRPRRCSYLPAPGCSCIQRFGRLTISCVGLRLMQFPSLRTLPPASRVTLDFSNNSFMSIPTGSFDDVTLVKFRLKYNQYPDGMRFPYDLFMNQPELHTIDMSDSNIAYMPHAVLKAKNLKHLNLKNNKILVIPRYLSDLTNLESLNLANNPIHSFNKGTFTGMTKLRKLSISVLNRSYDLAGVLDCDALSQLTYLEIVDTPLNQLSLKEVINDSCLSSLQHLTCDSCGLDVNSLGFVTAKNAGNFISIRLPNNKLRNYAMEMLGETAPISNLQVLDLSHNRIKAIREEDDADNFPSLVELNLKGNQISFIDATFFDLPELEFMDLRDNSMTSLDEFEWEENHTRVLLAGNPIVCYCDSDWLIKTARAQATGAMGPFDLFDLHHTVCAGPEAVKGTLLVYVDISGCE